jgi:hypothetical protein
VDKQQPGYQPGILWDKPYSEHQLPNLISNTTYVYRVYSKDAVNNLVSSGVFSFTTVGSTDIKSAYLPLILKS